MLVLPIPLNTIGWSLCSISSMILGVRSLSNWRKNNSAANLYMGWMGVTMSLSTASFSWPVYFSHDPAWLLGPYFIGIVFMFIGLLALAYLLRFLAVGVARLNWIIPVTIVLSLIGLYETYRYSSLDITPLVAEYSLPEFAAAIIGLLLIGLIVPIGLLFLRQGLRQTALNRIRSVLLGSTFVIAGFAAGINMIINRGRDTEASGLTYIVLFSFMIVAMLWPRHKTAPVKQSR